MNPNMQKTAQKLQSLQELQALLIKRDELAERVRLLTEQQEWLTDLHQQLAELSRMVRDQEYVTPAEAQSWYFSGKASGRSWHRAAQTGRVPCVHFGGKVFFRRADLDKVEREGTAPTAPPAMPPVAAPVKVVVRQPKPKYVQYRFFPSSPS